VSEGAFATVPLMALTVEFSDDEMAGLERCAATAGISVEEAACQAVRYFIDRRSFDDTVARLIERDRAILDRLAD
jgi:hypothetical protein